MAITFGVALALFAIKGTLIRFNGDDYCYAAVIRQYGFLKTQVVSYEEISFYNGNRYSLNFVMGIMSLFPPRAVGLLPGISIALWLSSIFFVIRQVSKILDLEIRLLGVLVLSETLLFLALYRAPNLTEILFWATGLATYLAPLIFNTFLLGVLLYASQQRQLHWSWYVLVALLSFIGGGFSETSAVVQFLWLFTFFCASLVYKRTDRKFLILVATALLTTGLSLLLLSQSPSAGLRWLKGSHPYLLAVGFRSIGYAADFIVDSIKSSYSPALVSFVVAFLLSAHERLHRTHQSNPGGSVRAILLIGLVGFLLIASSMAPSVYAQNAYPGDRALLVPEYLEMIALMLLGWVLGQQLGGSFHGPWQVVILAALFLVALYPVYASGSISKTLRRYEIWQTLWDLRDSQIRESEKNGIMDIETFKIDLDRAYDLDNINDLRSDPQFHYNRCAAQYYGVNSITADILPPEGLNSP